MTDDELVIEYAYILDREAWRAHRRVPLIDVDDYRQEAAIALLLEARRYDPSRYHDMGAFLAVRVAQRLIDATRRLTRTHRVSGRHTAASDVSRQVLVDSWSDDITPCRDEPGYAEVDEADALDHLAAWTAEHLGARYVVLLRGRAAGRTLAAIGADLGITETRTCQMLRVLERELPDVYRHQSA